MPVAPLPLSMQKAADINEATMALVCPPTRCNSRAHWQAAVRCRQPAVQDEKLADVRRKVDISFMFKMSRGRAVVSGGFLAARPSACTAGSETDPQIQAAPPALPASP